MQIHLEKLLCTLFFYPAVFISDLLQTSVSYFPLSAGKSAVCEIFTPARPAPTESLKSPFLPILMLVLRFEEVTITNLTHLNALSCCQVIG